MLCFFHSHQGLPVAFLLLRYPVLFTVESLSLLYLLFISWFICSRRWCIDKLGVFHANQISMCFDPHLNLGWGWCHETGLSSPVKYFTDCSKVALLLWIIYVFRSCVCYAFVCVCLIVPCGHLLGKGWPLGSRLWSLTVSLLLSHWYPGSCVVLDCIDSWSLHPKFICIFWMILLVRFDTFINLVQHSDGMYNLNETFVAANGVENHSYC